MQVKIPDGCYVMPPKDRIDLGLSPKSKRRKEMIIRRVVSLWPIILLACCFFVQGANGYEYHLQSPAGIGRITAVSTASIKADGTLSESLTSWTQACSGRVCAPRVYHCTAGTWDSIGNLLTSSTTAGACAANSPISTSGSEEPLTCLLLSVLA